MNSAALIIILLVIVVVGALLGGRNLNSPSQNLKTDMNSVGQDLKDLGRQTADGLRNAVE